MRGVALALALSAVPAGAHAVCDHWELVPHPENDGQYLFRYYNSPYHCSRHITGREVTAVDGFMVRLNVKTNGAPDESAELIWVVPDDVTFFAYPAEIHLPDDDEMGEILILSGIS